MGGKSCPDFVRWLVLLLLVLVLCRVVGTSAGVEAMCWGRYIVLMLAVVIALAVVVMMVWVSLMVSLLLCRMMIVLPAAILFLVIRLVGVS